MIDPNAELKPGQRISLPHETVSAIYNLLGELPAKNSMSLILAIQQEAEIVGEEPQEDA